MPGNRPAPRRARLHRPTAANLARLAAALLRGELVAVPTETVYGLAGDALNIAACRKIFRTKGRPATDPLIVHIHALAQLDLLAERNEAVEKIARAFWPGPLTIVLPKKPAVPALVTSGRPSVAVRMPAHPAFRALLKKCARPLAAPSANPFGYISPTSATHVLESLGAKIDHILDGGPATIGLESTILDLRDPRHPAILRPGAISAEEISRVLGRRVRRAKTKAPRADSASPHKVGALAPGLLTKHYSPRTPIALHRRLSAKILATLGPDEAALLIFPPLPIARTRLKPAEHPQNIFSLAAKPGDLAAAARRLFDSLRALDAGRWEKIHIELAPGRSTLALAINDRLTRAAAKR
jgi:L-threonylcarbamoyladenylate synthase